MKQKTIANLNITALCSFTDISRELSISAEIFFITKVFHNHFGDFFYTTPCKILISHRKSFEGIFHHDQNHLLLVHFASFNISIISRKFPFSKKWTIHRGHKRTNIVPWDIYNTLEKKSNRFFRALLIHLPL
jgi:hypothetical protein